jgi:hypothetical protein
MNTISINYHLKYEIKGNPEYQVTECRKVFNMKSGRQIKKTINSGMVGFWIKRKFIKESELRIKKIENLPF